MNIDDWQQATQPQLALLARMHELVRQGSQFVLATHAPILMACPGADVWQFDDDGITRTTAQHTDHWQILRSFLTRPNLTLDELLRDE